MPGTDKHSGGVLSIGTLIGTMASGIVVASAKTLKMLLI
jgi:hypothetical protein